MEKTELRALSDKELRKRLSEFKPNSERWIELSDERDRRTNRSAIIRFWIAIAISISAFIVSVLSYFKK